MAFPRIDDALLSRYDAPGPRYTSYPTAPTWSDAVGPAEMSASLVESGAGGEGPLSLYVHIPFCRAQCAYCGCNVVIASDPSKADRYLDTLELELGMIVGRLGGRKRVSQLHWGGGTPTFLNLEQIERLYSMVDDRFLLDDDAEIAIEIDPTVTSEAQLGLLRRLGFNRLSMGVQDFDSEVQAAVRRRQSIEDTAAIVTTARALGFASINFDLIYGLPEQTLDRWHATLDEVIQFAPDRLAVYSFAYLPDLRKNQRKLHVINLPTGKAKLALFGAAYDRFIEAGYETIGMDHFSLPSDDLARAKASRTLGRNFQGYTVQSATDSIGVGVSSISDVSGLFAQNLRGLTHYYERVSSGRLATTRGLQTSAEDRLRRRVITSLMCNHYVDLGPDGSVRFASELARLRALEDDGLLTLDGTAIALTEFGRIFVRNVAMVFDTYLAGGGEGRFSRTV